jgi:hypothetical protein
MQPYSLLQSPRLNPNVVVCIVVAGFLIKTFWTVVWLCLNGFEWSFEYYFGFIYGFFVLVLLLIL